MNADEKLKKFLDRCNDAIDYELTERSLSEEIAQKKLVKKLSGKRSP